MRRRFNQLTVDSLQFTVHSGQSLIEVVISIALAAILAISLISTTLITQRTSQSARNNTEATKLAQEWTEQIRVYRDRHDFERLYEAEDGTPQDYCRIYTPSDLNLWELFPSFCPEPIVKGTVEFKREFAVTNTSPADVNSKKIITVTVSWDEPGGQKQVVHDTVLSRWESF